MGGPGPDAFLGAKVLFKMTDAKGSSSSPDMHVLQMQWDETSCPICMDHPHNAVLLICSSHEKGCRSYICDTSYRHSNCLDRFKKVKVDHSDDNPSQSTSSFPEDSITESLDHVGPQNLTSEPILSSPRMRRNTLEADQIMFEAWEGSNLQDRYVEAHNVEDSASRITSGLKCPLCRGAVLGWKVVKEARRYLDLKPRSCSRESCSFSGNYGELRRHARRAHPATRPAAVDPSRQRAWRDLENQQEYRDILSAIRSAMPGAVVFEDYVIDDEGALSHDREVGDVSGPWWATLFLFHMMSSRSRFRDGVGSSSRSWRTRHHLSGQQNPQGANQLGLQDDNDDGDEDDDDLDAFRTWRAHRRSSRHRNLWGENLLGLQDDDNDDDDDDDISQPRRRQRSTRFRPDGEGR